jgi:hypothetical protein
MDDADEWVLGLVLGGENLALLELPDISRDVPKTIRAVLTDALTEEGSELGFDFFGGACRHLPPHECEMVLRAAGRRSTAVTRPGLTYAYQAPSAADELCRSAGPVPPLLASAHACWCDRMPLAGIMIRWPKQSETRRTSTPFSEHC